MNKFLNKFMFSTNTLKKIKYTDLLSKPTQNKNTVRQVADRIQDFKNGHSRRTLSRLFMKAHAVGKSIMQTHGGLTAAVV